MPGPVVQAELSARGRTATGGGSSLRGPNNVQLRLTFPPVPHRVRSVTLRLSGDLGRWELRVPIKPLGGLARRSEATAGGAATRHGVTLEMSEAVFDQDRTVVRSSGVGPPRTPIARLRPPSPAPYPPAATSSAGASGDSGSGRAAAWRP